jgi:hypothetical protein
MIKPTNGRVVWFMDRQLSDQPIAAFITYVHSDTLIDIVAFPPRSVGHHAIADVTLVQDTGDSDINVVKPYCMWMPYQKGQAAKTEALEAAIKSGGTA